MKSLLTLLSLFSLAAGAGLASGGTPPDLLKSSTRDTALTPGVAYQASLFAPPVRITAPQPGWRGKQWIDHAYNWLNVSRQDGGIAVVSAPNSSQSAATTLRLLKTERADSDAVGI